MNEKSGFRRGATWMEYVIVAVLIVAAIIAVVLYFGRDIMNTFGVAREAVRGNCSSACETQSMQENKSGHAAAECANKFFVDSQEAGCGCTAPRKAAETSARSAETSVQFAEVDIPLSDDDRGRGRNDVK